MSFSSSFSIITHNKKSKHYAYHLHNVMETLSMMFLASSFFHYLNYFYNSKNWWLLFQAFLAFALYLVSPFCEAAPSYAGNYLLE